MTNRQFSLLLGLVGQAGCIVYDDAIRREAFDGAIDVRGDGAARETGAGGARRDAIVSDVAPAEAETNGDASPESGAANDAGLSEDVVDAANAADARDVAFDAAVGPVDAPIADVLVDVRADGSIDIDARDAGRDGPLDASGDPPIVGCSVDFTVSGVAWDEDGSTEGDGGARVLHLVGNVGSLGAWSAEAGRAMTEKAPGAWSVGVALSDKVAIEFKFVKVPSGRAPQWEEWLPFDSNRSLLVACTAEGGTVWVDAATDAGPANRAVGRSYGGAFGVRPLDATK
jgi:hypothetical protein